MADDDEPALDNIVEEVADELGEALANIKPKSPSASISRPVTEAELAHYEEIMETLKSRWSGITAEAKVKMTIVNEDSVQREESMNEFKATWACHANSDGTLTREEFCVFNHIHFSNIKARLGWAPDLTKVDSEQTNLGGDSRSESGCNESGSAREPNVPHDLLMRARDAAWTPFPSYLSPVPDGLRKVLPPRRRATLSRRKWGKRRRLQTRPSRRERAPAHPPHAGTR